MIKITITLILLCTGLNAQVCSIGSLSNGAKYPSLFANFSKANHVGLMYLKMKTKSNVEYSSNAFFCIKGKEYIKCVGDDDSGTIFVKDGGKTILISRLTLDIEGDNRISYGKNELFHMKRSSCR
jgi:hypothetical protein